jgi:predicted MPP superfamily phosphohydrolase
MEGSDKFLVGAKVKAKTALRVLHVTDFHCDVHGKENLLRLKDHIVATEQVIDVVIATGDFLTIPTAEILENEPV